MFFFIVNGEPICENLEMLKDEIEYSIINNF